MTSLNQDMALKLFKNFINLEFFTSSDVCDVDRLLWAGLQALGGIGHILYLRISFLIECNGGLGWVTISVTIIP